jgi:hypothetical protein
LIGHSRKKLYFWAGEDVTEILITTKIKKKNRMNNSRLIVSVLVIGLLCAICSSGQPTGAKLVNITNLKSGDNVTWRATVEGNSSAPAYPGFKVHVLIWPIDADGPWWVQPTQTFSDGTWESFAFFGRDPRLNPEDIGTHYRVVAILTNQTLDGIRVLNELPIASRFARSEIIIVKRI